MRLGRTAVVLGGSMAGLSVVGALAPHFDEVLVLERDELPIEAEHRRGVPQSKHPHFLLNSGRRAIGELFPGFEADLIAAGGMPLIASMDTAHMTDVGWSPRKRGALDMVYGSRLLIERVLRDRVRALGNVTIREGVTVTGINTDGAGRVVGVKFSGEEVDADLVVDALGRGSKVSDWLVAAGHPEVPVITLDAKVTYVSQWYDLPSAEDRADTWWWKHMVIMPTEKKGDHPIEHEYLSNFFPIEGNRSIACMGSWGLNMPKNEEEFIESAGRLQTPKFLAAMEASTPTSEVHLTKSTGNKWRRYDKLPAAPQGIVFVGDSICAFNPFYAQGISSAALSAVRLRDALQSTSALEPAFYERFLAGQAKELKGPWSMAMARDRGYDCATGTETIPSWMRRILRSVGASMFNAITGASREDAAVDEHFARVFNLDESVGTMMSSPRVIYGLLRFKVKDMFGRHKIPFGFDPQLDPPGRDWSVEAGTAEPELEVSR
ncbi:FAD-dependent oxidoreductase [Aeromicrobium sp.]|uniref:FAD-dependent oxidoreductase n=1 Tax=Aeromicrobium sp. TaxID=1871063 RepID=UPI002FCA64B7